jgi:hypothetical protein
MRWSTLEERFSRFVMKPSFQRYCEVRQLVLTAPDYDPYFLLLETIGASLDEGDFRAVLAACDALGPSCCLSPRIHVLAGISAEETGDLVRARREKRLAQACLRALRQSGDGTAEHPFLVTFLSDEYDLLRSLQAAAVVGQQLIETGAGQCDLICCEDGTEYWFDVTDLLAVGRPRARSRSMGRSQPSAVRPV